MREDGLNVDRLLLAERVLHADGDRTRGDGPPESGDSTAPTLTGREPAPGATAVAVGANVVATFSEAMNPATLTGSTFTLAPTAGGPAVTASDRGLRGEHDLHAEPARQPGAGHLHRDAHHRRRGRRRQQPGRPADLVVHHRGRAGPGRRRRGDLRSRPRGRRGRGPRRQGGPRAARTGRRAGPAGSVGAALQAAPDTGARISYSIATTARARLPGALPGRRHPPALAARSRASQRQHAARRAGRGATARTSPSPPAPGRWVKARVSCRAPASTR